MAKETFEQFEVHPLALLYPEMPQADFDLLKANIREYGLKEPIVLFQGKILDGRHRYRALRELCEEGKATVTNRLGVGLHCEIRGKNGFSLFTPCELYKALPQTEQEAEEYVHSKNLHRRHLSLEQRRAMVAQILRDRPERSDRQVAAEAKVSHPTVAKVRAELEEAGEVETFSTRVDKKGVEQPATKPERTSQNVQQIQQIQQKSANEALNMFWGEEESADLPESPIALDAGGLGRTCEKQRGFSRTHWRRFLITNFSRLEPCGQF